MTNAQIIEKGLAILGVELGSTRIKSTLITPDSTPIASGSYGWENKLEDGVWTYHIDDVWKGIAASFADLANDVKRQYGVALRRLASAGFSGMMHGYVALDKDDELLVPFRTWRNNITEHASSELTALFGYPIAQRWSIAHLYQAVLNNETHLPKLSHITTIAGYVHMKLTGRKVLGLCEASGMFPADPATNDYDQAMIDAFDQKVAPHKFPWKVRDLLPQIMKAGSVAGELTADGARLLDPTGTLASGVPFCPPEGDAGTGMIATNSVRPRTGNVSAGTSAFAMVVLEKRLSKVHPEIDLLLTPDGALVGMAHSNNCTSDFDAWVSLFGQAGKAMGIELDANELYAKLMPLALKGDPDAGGLLAYGYISGEHVTGFSEGRPLFARNPNSAFTIENFIRVHLFASLGALRTGLNILTDQEGVRVDEIRGHGGFFKTPEVGQRIMAAATGTPVSVMETAGEGGSWGMALLAAYTIRDKKEQSLADYLDEIFAGSTGSVLKPEPKDVEGFNRFFDRYSKGIPIERAAVQTLE